MKLEREVSQDLLLEGRKFTVRYHCKSDGPASERSLPFHSQQPPPQVRSPSPPSGATKAQKKSLYVKIFTVVLPPPQSNICLLTMKIKILLGQS